MHISVFKPILIGFPQQSTENTKIFNNRNFHPHIYIIPIFSLALEFPEQNPTIDDIKQYYSVGDYLETNCTSNSSIPPAMLEWWINDMPAHIEHNIKYETIVDPISSRETSILGLRLPLSNEHFYQGRLKVSESIYFILFFFSKFAAFQKCLSVCLSFCFVKKCAFQF
jgi:hypothetical protein